MKNGDFIKMDFVGRLVATGEIFDSTSEEQAKKDGVHDPKQKYGPILIIIGASMTVPGVEKHLMEMRVGEEREFDVKPSEAFGQRSPELMRVLPINKFIKEKINPVPGMFVTIDHRQAKIQSVSGGRIRVDFNHPLASRELHYKIKITELIENPLEKAKTIADYFAIKCEAELKEDALTIKTEKKAPAIVEKLLGDWIKKYITDIKSIAFVSKEGSKTKPTEKKEISTGKNPDTKP
ncbi:MAG: peptidylprolyl isomerase [Nanoarchaeota archaeon]